MLGPFATASRRTPHCHSPGVTACASMSTTTTTTTTTTTRDRADRYGPVESVQLFTYLLPQRINTLSSWKSATMPCHKLIINNITLTIKLTAICCILLIYRAGCGAVQYRQLSRRSVACVFYDMHVCKCAWCVEETASAEWSEREREREREKELFIPRASVTLLRPRLVFGAHVRRDVFWIIN